MADRNIFTRVYSQKSSGALVSGKGRSNRPLFPGELLHEFWNHSKLYSEDPTALVSVSSRIMDTLKRAFSKHLYDKEPAEGIWIVFLELPGDRYRLPAGCHAASELASACKSRNPEAFGHDDIGKFRYEYVFEHKIPKKYVVHKVSLETLMSRGLNWHRYFTRWEAERDDVHILLSTSALREYISKKFLEVQKDTNSWEVGVALGFFARAFGARAPSCWIASQLYDDCDKGLGISRFQQELRDDGIDHALVYWWLEDLGTSDEYLYFEWWRDVMEEVMINYQLEFSEAWYMCNDSYMVYLGPNPVPGLSYNKELKKMKLKCLEIQRSIEDEAVRLGL